MSQLFLKFSGLWYVYSELGTNIGNCSRHFFQVDNLNSNSSSNATNASMVRETVKFIK